MRRGAIADSGAEVSTFPQSAFDDHPEIVDNIGPAAPDTTVCYGNGNIVPIEKVVQSGDYEIEVAPDHCANCLISVNDLTRKGHYVVFAKHNITIADVDNQYSRTYPRQRGARDWTLPIGILQELTRLRRMHPLSRQSYERGTADTPPESPPPTPTVRPQTR